MSSYDRAARAAEAKRFLEANRDIRLISVIVTDNCGVQRGKLLTRDELVGVFEKGRFLPGSFRVLDVTGRDVEETRMVWEDGDADRIALPVEGTLMRTPWTETPQGQYLGWLHELDGTPCIVEPRATLKRVVDRLAELDLTPVAAIELEFYLLDRESALDGRPSPPKGLTNGARPQHYQAYLLQDIEDFSPFFRDLYEMAEQQGLPVQTAISEYAPGQMELALHHRADALKACDEAIMYKTLVKAVAEKHGLIATFMAKPYSNFTGSGMHVHASLAGKDGRNAFAAEKPEDNALLLNAIGGLKATMGDGMAIFAPNANSYRRFRKNSYAPIAPTWGFNNRTVSLRIPATVGQGMHIEHRSAGADANPYLVLAAVLAGMHHGIVEGIDPGPAAVGNAYELKDVPKMPTNWYRALEVMRGSQFLRDYFSDEFVDTFATVKEAEADRFYAEPSRLDFDYYLRTI
ncbi:MAG: glutamine synthetase family protein [Hyphomicrobiaceae bacterium]